jgi:hypothetical protein
MPGIIYSINGEAKSLSNEDINEREAKWIALPLVK